jgi:hypothetical protein
MLPFRNLVHLDWTATLIGGSILIDTFFTPNVILLQQGAAGLQKGLNGVEIEGSFDSFINGAESVSIAENAVVCGQSEPLKCESAHANKAKNGSALDAFITLLR